MLYLKSLWSTLSAPISLIPVALENKIIIITNIYVLSVFRKEKDYYNSTYLVAI